MSRTARRIFFTRETTTLDRYRLFPVHRRRCQQSGPANHEGTNGQESCSFQACQTRQG
jgi:hypothetical protein